MAEKTVGDRLIELRARSGLSMDKVAEGMGLSGRSSVQRLFASHLESLEVKDALRLAEVFDGKGDPPIKRDEVLALAGIDRLFEVRPNDTPAPRYYDLPRDVPVFGTAIGTYKIGGEQPEIEQTFLDYSDEIERLARPPGYANRKGLYGLYVAGTSMEPRWDAGDPLYVDPKRPPQIGDDVVVYLVRPLAEDREIEAVLLKRLVRQSATFVELQQYNPELTFRIERRRIKSVHRVIPKRELLAFN